MKVLFSSDLHGMVAAFERFAEMLARPEFGVGVLAGDLKDDYVPKSEAIERFGLEPDDVLDELYPAENTPEQNLAMRNPEWIDRSLRLAEVDLKAILSRSGKPVLVIMGNHDKLDWEDGGHVVNMHMRRLDLGQLSVVGYRYTTIEKDETAIAQDLRKIEHLVDESTMLVTHQPPRGVLDDGIDSQQMGSNEILKFVERCRPAWHLFGHVHSQYGWIDTSVNGSYPEARKFLSIDTATADIQEIL
jgi:Icc-related predicted phosphoesterase